VHQSPVAPFAVEDAEEFTIGYIFDSHQPHYYNIAEFYLHSAIRNRGSAPIRVSLQYSDFAELSIYPSPSFVVAPGDTTPFSLYSTWEDGGTLSISIAMLITKA
jgi:hypothetical protein